MRTLTWMLFLAAFAVTVRAAEPAPDKPTYDLHEWGVFTVPRNDAWAQRDMKQEWAGFPEFFNRSWPMAKLPFRGPVRKPVIYFHATGKLSVQLTVRFAEGRPIVWWPPAQDELTQPDRLIFDLSLAEPFQPDQGVPPYQVAKGHWMETLRAAKSSKVYTNDGWSRLGTRFVSEHFVYYDGVMKAPATPKATRDGEKVNLEFSGDARFEDLMVIERDEKGVRCGAWTRWDGTPVTKILVETVTLKPATDDDLARLRKEFVERLAKAGLNADEAEALAAVWHEGLFKAQGLTVFYRVPQTTYDAWLPLEAKPAPAKCVRVGVVIHEHLEPELDARVDALIKQLGNEAFEVREKAQRELTALGGAAFPALEKAAGSDDPEIAKACRAVLSALDVKPALDEKPKIKAGSNR